MDREISEALQKLDLKVVGESKFLDDAKMWKTQVKPLCRGISKTWEDSKKIGLIRGVCVGENYIYTTGKIK